MCGIVGLVATQDRGEIRHLLRRMNDTILHRGPDDSGFHVAPNIGLGMRRLSIIDLSGGQQPMHTDDGVTIVFSGEIYNYVALREELIGRGYQFRTRCDTEVILNLYHALGTAAFARLHGMFAVAIHDARNDELVLARDQTGIKPLYYRPGPDGIMFASEIKAILAVLEAKPAVNPQAVWDFLSLRYVPPPDTIWQGIFKLEPGHFLRFPLKTRSAEITCYWRPNLTPEPFDPSRDYDREFEEQFLAAVQCHLASSDVPIGLFLSGGLDSGAICAAAVELGYRDFHTFSIGGEDNGHDNELPLAFEVSGRFGTHHHETIATRQNYFDELDRVAWHFDEPYGDETGAAILMLSQEAHKYVKVVMSGDGADELLLGYSDTAKMKAMAAIERRYLPWPPMLLNLLSHGFKGRRASVLREIAAGGPWAYYKGAGAHIGRTLSDEEKAGFWRGGPQRATHDLVMSWYTLPTTVEPLAQIQQSDFQTWLVEDLLMKTDKMPMAVSLEARLPFLHLPLVEWCQRSPMEIRIGDARKTEIRSKAVLRNFAAGRLPDTVLNQPKRGFPVPTIHWFGQLLREQEGLMLVSKAIHDWIDMRGLDKLVARGLAGQRPALAKLWGVVMLDRWFKAYVD